MPKETNKRTARQKDADELHMTSTLSAPSINLLTLIEANTSSIDTTLDISLSVFRDALLGANTKDFSTIQTVLDSIKDTDGIKKITDVVKVYPYDADTWDIYVKGTVTANPTPLSTMLSSAITLTNADQAYKLPATEQSGRTILVIYNISDTLVYIGGSGVETTDGMPLASSKYMVIPASASVYAVCGAAGKKLRLMECK